MAAPWPPYKLKQSLPVFEINYPVGGLEKESADV